jgi:hypothetical protein
MSQDPSRPDIQPDASAPPPVYNRLGGCAATFLVVLGLILVLPGVCSLIFMGAFGSGGGAGGGLAALWFLTFAIAAGGIALIVYAVRHR